MIRTIERQRSRLGLPPKTIILSFDDGPAGETQCRGLLQVLEAYEIHGVFCLVGNQVTQRPHLCAELHAGGHFLANHTYSHRSTMMKDDAYLCGDMQRADTAIGQAIGQPDYRATHFRPPGGLWHGRVQRVLEAESKELMPMTFFAWDVMNLPWAKEQLLRLLIAGAIRDQGGLFCLHEQVLPLDGRESEPNDSKLWLPEVVDRFIHVMKRRGYTFLDPHEFWGQGTMASEPDE